MLYPTNLGRVSSRAILIYSYGNSVVHQCLGTSGFYIAGSKSIVVRAFFHEDNLTQVKAVQ